MRLGVAALGPAEQAGLGVPALTTLKSDGHRDMQAAVTSTQEQLFSDSEARVLVRRLALAAACEDSTVARDADVLTVTSRM